MHPVPRRYLDSLAAAGVRRLPKPHAVSPATTAPGSEAPAHNVAAPAAAPGEERAQRTEAHFAEFLDDRLPPRPENPEAVLEQIASEVLACRACTLCESRTRAVPGEGSANARVLFVGEGPGAEEDRSGRPFVGRSGQLLDDIITKGMKLRRADVFIANVVKCRPPDNRAPLPDEVAACRAHLERQIATIAPAVICTLGATATHLLLQTDQPMRLLRGRLQNWHGIPVVPTYHPAYLLRNPAAKKPTWEDIQQVLRVMQP